MLAIIKLTVAESFQESQVKHFVASQGMALFEPTFHMMRMASER
jgi:hypothetical protein